MLIVLELAEFNHGWIGRLGMSLFREEQEALF